jgi:hypothetical protein
MLEESHHDHDARPRLRMRTCFCMACVCLLMADVDLVTVCKSQGILQVPGFRTVCIAPGGKKSREVLCGKVGGMGYDRVRAHHPTPRLASHGSAPCPFKRHPAHG